MSETKPRKTEDRRVKRTKKILKECLFSLLEEKSIDEITVKELTEKADVNRSTFYFYYKDINDMLMQIQDGIFEVFEKNVMAQQSSFVTIEDFEEYVSRFLMFCKEHESICKFVISNDPNNNLAKKVKKTLFNHIPDSTKVFSPEDPKYYMTIFALSAMWETIIQWMYDGMKISPEKMTKFMINSYFYGGRTVLENDLV